MKSTIVFLFFLIGAKGFSQVYNENYKLKFSSDLQESEDKAITLEQKSKATLTLRKIDAEILESANYIMNHPIDPLDPIRNEAMGTVLLWMMNTPDYTFYIDETIVPVIKQNEEILAIYMVSMAQFVLEKPNQANNSDEIKLQAFTKLLAYCDNPINNIKKSKAISQAIYAMRTGWLKEYLKIS